jgi:hypothetical protein
LIWRDNLKKLKNVEVKEQYQTKNSNRYAVLENLDDYVDINRGCRSITENTKTSA